MSRSRKPSPLNDPTLPKTPIEINGKTYHLCFDFGALAEAESKLNVQGHNVNLLAALPILNLANVRVIFACAVQAHHPELTFEEAGSLVTFRSVYAITEAIANAWKEAIPEVEIETQGNAPGE